MNISRRDCLKTVAAASSVPVFSTSLWAASEPTLEGASYGKYVTGPKLKKSQLKDRVIVFEYWGHRCGPCLASIPHLCKLQKKHGRDKLLIIANQVWTKNIAAAKQAWESRATNKLVTVVNHGALKDVRVRGVPTCFVFDPKGKFVWKGHPRGGLDAAIDKALKA
ncbi:MAG: TlpA disulfide reductase family protein [Phycisphaeraceae bacterium]|nr:TlpA disulfide reductase family protein [Phycisphaeraceae bacterium]